MDTHTLTDEDFDGFSKEHILDIDIPKLLGFDQRNGPISIEQEKKGEIPCFYNTRRGKLNRALVEAGISDATEYYTDYKIVPEKKFHSDGIFGSYIPAFIYPLDSDGNPMEDQKGVLLIDTQYSSIGISTEPNRNMVSRSSVIFKLFPDIKRVFYYVCVLRSAYWMSVSVERNDSIAQEFIDRASDWWDTVMIKNEPSEPLTVYEVEHLYSRSNVDDHKIATKEIESIISQIHQLLGEKEDVEETISILKTVVMKYLGSSEYLMSSDGTRCIAAWVSTRSKYVIDWDKVMEDIVIPHDLLNRNRTFQMGRRIFKV